MKYQAYLVVKFNPENSNNFRKSVIAFQFYFDLCYLANYLRVISSQFLGYFISITNIIVKLDELTNIQNFIHAVKVNNSVLHKNIHSHQYSY